MISRYGLYLAWILACLGSVCSLFFSEVLGYEPCHLCWYQRICLFPLTLILGISAFHGDAGIVKCALPLSLAGLLFAAYQITIQEIPQWNPIELCGAGPPCSEKHDIGLGFISIPLLSLVNFFLICFLLLLVHIQASKKPPHPHPH